jgi:hypothetical protein
MFRLTQPCMIVFVIALTTIVTSNAAKAQGPGDLVPPSIELVELGIDALGHHFAEFEVQDLGAGLQSIAVLDIENGNFVVPPFTLGTIDPVLPRLTQIDTSLGFTTEFRACDLVPNCNQALFVFDASGQLVAPVAEPATWPLLAAGVIGVTAARRRLSLEPRL